MADRDQGGTAARARAEDLQRRIDELESLDEAAFGVFGAVDWWLCVVGAVILPALALWWYA